MQNIYLPDCTNLDQNMLEKIGFSLRCYKAMSDFSFVPFERDEYEVYFALACLAAGTFGENKEEDMKAALTLINGCVEICVGKEEHKKNKE